LRGRGRSTRPLVQQLRQTIQAINQQRRDESELQAQQHQSALDALQKRHREDVMLLEGKNRSLAIQVQELEVRPPTVAHDGIDAQEVIRLRRDLDRSTVQATTWRTERDAFHTQVMELNVEVALLRDERRHREEEWEEWQDQNPYCAPCGDGLGHGSAADDAEEEASDQDEDVYSEVQSTAFSCHDSASAFVAPTSKTAVGAGTATRTQTTTKSSGSAGRPPQQPPGAGDPNDGDRGSASGSAAASASAGKAAPKNNPKSADRRPPDDEGDGDDDGDEGEDDDENISDGERWRRLQAANQVSSTSPTLQTKRKELDKVDITDLPKSAAEYETWFLGASNAVSAAAIDPDAALKWVCEVEEPSATFETFMERSAEPSLDAKLMTAIIKAAENNDVLLALINKASREQRKAEGVPLRGSQAL